MTEDEVSRLLLAVEHKIEKTVNGKIIAIGKDVTALHEMLQRQNEKTDVTAQQLATHLEREVEFQTEIRKHMEDVRPVIEAYKGTKVVGEMMKWVSSVGIGAWGLYALLRGLK